MAKGAPEQQGGGADNSLDLLWGGAIFIALVFIIWYFGKVYISDALFTLKIYEIYIIKFIFAKLDGLAKIMGMTFSLDNNLNDLLSYIKTHYGNANIQFANLAAVCTAVGLYLRVPLIGLICIGAILLHFGGASHRFRHKFDTQSLKKLEKENWPQIIPVADLDLVGKKLDDGPWAMALSPMLFCKKNALIDEEQKAGKYIVKLKRGAAYRLLSLQLGSRWHGPKALPIFLQALFAIFVARIAGDKAVSEKLMDDISNSANNADSRPSFSLRDIENLIIKYGNNKKVARVCGLHGYVSTVFASLLVAAREVGVLATSEFIWLKPMDRRMF